MRNRPWMIVLFGLITIATALGIPSPSHAADERSYAVGYFALMIAGTQSVFVSSFGDEGASAEVVTEQLANAPIGDAFCRVRITFYSKVGLVLHFEELTLGPGQIGSVDLPLKNQPTKGEPFRISFQVLDEDKNGKIRPCRALPSARVYEMSSGKTKYYLPIVTN